MCTLTKYKGLFWLLVFVASLFASPARVLAAPPNDNYNMFVPISGQTGSITGTNMLASYETGEPYDWNGRTVWYKWMAPVSGGITLTLVSDYNLYCRVYTGTVVNNLTRVGYNETGYRTPIYTHTFNAVAGTIYSIQIQDYNNAQGSFTLSWQPGPANDNFVNALPLSGRSFDMFGTNVQASYEGGEPNDWNGRTVWYTWTAPASGGATLAVTSSNALLYCRVYTGPTVSSLTRINYNETGYRTNKYTLTFNAVVGTTYAIQIQDYNNSTGTFNLFGGLAPDNDLFINAQAITGRFGRVTGLNFPASSEAGEPNHGGVAGGASVWFKWMAPVSGLVTFNTDGSDFNTLLGVYTGNSVGALTTIGGNDNYVTGVNYSSAVKFLAIKGTTYYIALDGYNALTGHYVLRWTSEDSVLSWHGAPQGDLIWQNQNTGAVLYYLENGASKVGEGYLWTGGDTSWKLVFTADLNGDGKPDLVFQNSNNGAVYCYLMDGVNKISEGYIWAGGDTNWKLVAYGDLNNDGRADLVFQYKTTGQVVYYLMNGGNTLSQGVLWAGGDPTWKVVGLTDVNGDGHPDIIFQNAADNGSIYCHLFDGVTKIGEDYIWRGTDANQRVIATADMNGDGKPDLLLQNASTGAVTCFVLNGLSVFDTRVIWNGGDPTWKLTGVSEFNRDYKPDLVFQNSSNGAAYYYLMDNLNITYQDYLWTGGDTSWRLLLTPHN